MTKEKILKFYLTAIVCIVLIVPYQFSLTYKGNHKAQFYGYNLLFTPPTPPTPAWTTEIAFQRIGLEIIAVSAIAGIIYISKK